MSLMLQAYSPHLGLAMTAIVVVAVIAAAGLLIRRHLARRRKRPLRAQFWRQLRSFWSGLGLLLRYFVVAAYFYLWSYKTEIRHHLKFTSLVLVSAQTALLGVEVIAEIMGAERVHNVLIEAFHPPVRYYMSAIFIASVIFLFWHHYHDLKKPDYEFRFVKGLHEFMEDRGSRVTISARTRRALELFHSIFTRVGVIHVSAYSVVGKKLVIDPDEVFPRESDPSFFVPLEPGEGVAGRVYEDSKPRYTPRLFFPFRSSTRLPNMFFPHAIKFDFQAKPDDQGLELIDVALDTDAFKTNPAPGGRASRPHFNACLSVPIRSSAADKCLGVLNFDFQRPDPLDKRDIAMAVVLGLILGQDRIAITATQGTP